MTRERYNPVPMDVPAMRKRWSKNPAFAKAFDALADEFAALRHHADAGCSESHTLTTKLAKSRRSKSE